MLFLLTMAMSPENLWCLNKANQILHVCLTFYFNIDRLLCTNKMLVRNKVAWKNYEPAKYCITFFLHFNSIWISTTALIVNRNMLFQAFVKVGNLHNFRYPLNLMCVLLHSPSLSNKCTSDFIVTFFICVHTQVCECAMCVDNFFVRVRLCVCV